MESCSDVLGVWISRNESGHNMAECLNFVWTESEVWFKSNLAKNHPQPHCDFFIHNPFFMEEEKEEKKELWATSRLRGAMAANLGLAELNFTPNFVLKHRALFSFIWLGMKRTSL